MDLPFFRKKSQEQPTKKEKTEREIPPFELSGYYKILTEDEKTIAAKLSLENKKTLSCLFDNLQNSTFNDIAEFKSRTIREIKNFLSMTSIAINFDADGQRKFKKLNTEFTTAYLDGKTGYAFGVFELMKKFVENPKAEFFLPLTQTSEKKPADVLASLTEQERQEFETLKKEFWALLGDKTYADIVANPGPSNVVTLHKISAIFKKMEAIVGPKFRGQPLSEENNKDKPQTINQ